MRINSKILVIPTLILLTTKIYAQDLKLLEKDSVLSGIIKNLEKVYPFPEISQVTIAGLQSQISDGFYDNYNTVNEFASQVTRSLESFSNDKHLDLVYNPLLAEALLVDTTFDDSSLLLEEARIEVWNNYGFKELSILDGNIGYLNLSVFFATAYAGKTADIVMNFFSNCNALIIDLRQNGGGWDDMVNYLLGYFIEKDEPILRNIMISTLDSTYYSAVIPNYVHGKKLTNIPLYVLTSPATASAAECFASNLKYFNKNVTLVGENTAGAENPVTHIAINNNFVLQIPTWKRMYSNNPIVWEGIGIKPDIEVETINSKRIAHLDALEKLIKITNDSVAIKKYQWAIDGLNANHANIDGGKIKNYIGKYDMIKILFMDGKLYYQYKDHPLNELIPISDNYFVVEGIDYFRLKFIFTNGNIVLKQIFTYGVEREYSKNK